MELMDLWDEWELWEPDCWETGDPESWDDVDERLSVIPPPPPVRIHPDDLAAMAEMSGRRGRNDAFIRGVLMLRSSGGGSSRQWVCFRSVWRRRIALVASVCQLVWG